MRSTNLRIGSQSVLAALPRSGLLDLEMRSSEKLWARPDVTVRATCVIEAADKVAAERLPDGGCVARATATTRPVKMWLVLGVLRTSQGGVSAVRAWWTCPESARHDCTHRISHHISSGSSSGSVRACSRRRSSCVCVFIVSRRSHMVPA